MRQSIPAPVRPRFVSSATGFALPLEDEVQSLLDQPAPAIIALVGGPGSGKTTALNHLRATFGRADRLRLIDDLDDIQHVKQTFDKVTVCAMTQPQGGSAVRRLALAGWGRDEWIEYLLAMHPSHCASVIARLSKSDAAELGDNPEIWQVVLEQLAADDSLPDALAALLHFLRVYTPSQTNLEALARSCLESEIRTEANLFHSNLFKHSGRLKAAVWRLVRHQPVRQALAAERLAADLNGDRPRCELPSQMPRDLVRAVARCIASSECARAQLRAAVEFPAEQPMAMSLLHVLEPSWKPMVRQCFFLTGAYLDGACWPGMDLRAARLRGSDFSGADLRNANLEKADAFNANFSRAVLAGANLCGFNGAAADISETDLSSVRAERVHFEIAKLCGANLTRAHLQGAIFLEADLRGAILRHSRLSQANLQGALIDDADFTSADVAGANLSGLVLRKACFDAARFHKALLLGADLEGMSLDGADFEGANLEGALLTGSSALGGNFSRCCLKNAGLADVEWEGASLRAADLRGASFHLGSSRSGLVGSPIASEGSRTGFYTDDFAEQDFKAPEEIRKANLCYADLRQAVVTGADFYLVDLRGAIYDAEQRDHFRRCGAILEDRCPQ